MDKVSIIIPARNEKMLAKTVANLLANAAGEVEIIVVLDGPSSFEVPSGIQVITKDYPEGLRAAIDDGIAAATGKYLFRIDAHCAFSPGYDQILKEDHQDNWLVIPRRYYLDPETMQPDTTVNSRVATVDYFYFACPWTDNRRLNFLNACPHFKRTRDKKNQPIDETMAIAGSAWFCLADYYKKTVGQLRRNHLSWGEHLPMIFKFWLGDGQVMVNKKLWYAHLDNSRAKLNRGYDLDMGENLRECIDESEYWLTNQWPGKKHDFSWLVEKFWPLPSENYHVSGESHFWPEDWRKYL